MTRGIIKCNVKDAALTWTRFVHVTREYMQIRRLREE